MNLERVEELCLSYLGQTTNPLVPVETLLGRCRREKECGDLTLDELLPFLRNHDLFRVLEGAQAEDLLGVDSFAEAGIYMGPRAILASRIPSPKEMSSMMAAQLDVMLQTLTKAVADAEESGNDAAGEKLREALARAEGIRERMGKLL